MNVNIDQKFKVLQLVLQLVSILSLSNYSWTTYVYMERLESYVDVTPYFTSL